MTRAELAQFLGGKLDGADGPITGAAPAGEGGPGDVTFAGSEEYLRKALDSEVGVILVPEECPALDRPVIRMANPRLGFGFVLAKLSRPLPLATGIHPTAVVSEGASVAEDASVGPYCVVESGAVIDSGARVYAHAYVGENCHIGEQTVLYPGVVLYQDVSVGRGCILHTGVVLGADGFGFAWDGEKRIKVPQIGGVEIGDDVELGANTTVDRATTGATRIGRNTKIDNLTMVAHNVSLGESVALAAQVGIAGSSRIGNRVVMGGQVGMADHTNITDDVMIAGKSGVAQDIVTAGEYFGSPVMPKKKAFRQLAILKRLPDLLKRVSELERKLEDK